MISEQQQIGVSLLVVFTAWVVALAIWTYIRTRRASEPNGLSVYSGLTLLLGLPLASTGIALMTNPR